MFICFVASLKTAPQPHLSRRINGRQWSLTVIRSEENGPWYPHIAESETAEDYRFFAGRMAGILPSDALPNLNPFTTASADDWSFPVGEPGGSWIALKFDRKSDTLSFTSDLFLLQRWYYTEIAGQWFIANSLRFLVECLDAADVDWRGVVYMLAFSYLPGRFTPVKNAFSLRSGEMLVIKEGKGRIEKRAGFPIYNRSPLLPECETSDAIYTALQNAVASELEGVDSILLPLSGGMDSRFLIALAKRILPCDRITAVTFGHPSSFDFRIGVALARHVNVPSVTLPMDERPVLTLVEENFASAEGVHSAWPFYPVQPYRTALGKHTLVLSGYVGDVVFGSFDMTENERRAIQSTEMLVSHLVHSLCETPLDIVKPLMAEDDIDPLNAFAALYAAAETDGLMACHRWIYENHQMNRTNFALEVHRDCAYYIAPFVHRNVLNVAYALSPELRSGERAYFESLRDHEPGLFKFPTTANYGFPLTKRGLAPAVIRTWRKTMNLLDEKIAARWGRILYHHPRTNYMHYRILSCHLHRESVLQCLEELQKIPALNPTALRELRERYLKSQPLHWPLLRELFTLYLWQKHYHKSR